MELSRVPHVDLSILRLAAYELYHRADVPDNVAVSEAMEMANRYSEPKSGATSTASWAQWYATSRSQRHKRPHGGKERANARDPGF